MADISESLDHQKHITLLSALLADVTNIRTALTTLTAKLDTDFTAQNSAVTSSQLDVDYASTVNPAALTTTT